jgi:UDP-3-O-[3-hydroxymyristoyl] glucosamine N-acyltransferase
MEFSAQQIAALLNGTIEGNANASVSNLSKIEEGKPGTLTFLANPTYTPHIYETDASIVIINRSLALTKPVKATCTLIRVDDAYGSFATLLEMYNQVRMNKTGIEQPSHISKSASLGKDCYVGAFAYVGENVKIGNNVKIYPHCYIGEHVTIGDNCTFF